MWMVPAFCRRDADGEVLSFGRLHARADGPAFHLPAVGIQRKPLLRGTQERPLRDGCHRTDGNRGGRERKTICPAHQREEHPRLIQEAVREAAPTDTANDTATAAEKQGIQTVIVIWAQISLSFLRSLQKNILFLSPKMSQKE